MHRPRLAAVAACVGAALLSAACAPQVKSLYVWDTYQAQLHQHFKGDGQSVEQQVAAMELHLQKAAAANGAVPPGFHAHLGLLKMRLGRQDEALAHLQTEKTRYPESAPYMDTLLRRAAAAPAAKPAAAAAPALPAATAATAAAAAPAAPAKP